MPLSDGIPSSPPGPSTSAADAIAYYKVQYESLEAELADFQASSKELEAELEKDIDAAEKRERQLKEKADNLAYEVDEWKTKYKQSKAEANAVQSTLQKEITTLRDANRTLQMRLRDTEVANDDYERQQRNTESSLEDLESKYTMAIERSVLMEGEMKVGEQEREALRIDAQRLRDELSDLRIEAEVIKEKLRKAEANMDHRRRLPPLEPVRHSASPRSELSPTTTDSSPSLDTPPGKTVSSSAISDAHTPPSPPMSERSANATKPFKTAGIPKTRLSITANNATSRQSIYGLKPPGHSRGPSVPVTNGRSTPSTNFRQSLSRPRTVAPPQDGLQPSKSMHQLHNLQNMMVRLTERVNTAKSKLPAPVFDTPPKASSMGSSADNNIPDSVTVRSNRKRINGSTISGPTSLPESHRRDQQLGAGSMVGTGPPSIRARPSRQTLAMPPPAATPTRPDSRASVSTASSRPSTNLYKPSHSRPGSRASMSISSARSPLAPNASTDRIRPKSTLSYYGHDGAMDEGDEPGPPTGEADFATPTPRHATTTIARGRIGTASKRISDFGTGTTIPSTVKAKRLSVSRLPAPTTSVAGRLSLGGKGHVERDRDRNMDYGDRRPGSGGGGGGGGGGAGGVHDLCGVNEAYDVDNDDETF